MVPVPIYTASPINIAKSSGVTPQTEAASRAASSVPRTTARATGMLAGRPPAPQPGAVPSTAGPTTAVSGNSDYEYSGPGPGPGSGPSLEGGLVRNDRARQLAEGQKRSAQTLDARPDRLPAAQETRVVQETVAQVAQTTQVQATQVQATHTTAASICRKAVGTPPAPQPGAVPAPPAGGTVGVASRPSRYPPREQAHENAVDMTPRRASASSSFGASSQQRHYEYLHAPYSSQMTAMAPAAAPYPLAGLQPNNTNDAGGPAAGDLSHPPGYVQNVHAGDVRVGSGEMESQATNTDTGSIYSNGYDDEGVWDAAKKLAKAAGERLSEAESGIWRLINKE